MGDDCGVGLLYHRLVLIESTVVFVCILSIMWVGLDVGCRVGLTLEGIHLNLAIQGQKSRAKTHFIVEFL